MSLNTTTNRLYASAQCNDRNLYPEIPGFTDSFLKVSEPFIIKYAVPFVIWTEKMEVTPYKSIETVFMDLVMAGFSWHIYIAPALRTPKIMFGIMSVLSAARMKFPGLRSIIDGIRGLIFTRITKDTKKPVHPKYTLKNFERLIFLLKSTGEYTEEVKKLMVVHNYLRILTHGQTDTFLENLHMTGTFYMDRTERLVGKSIGKPDDLRDITREIRHANYLMKYRYNTEYLMSLLTTDLSNRDLKIMGSGSDSQTLNTIGLRAS